MANTKLADALLWIDRGPTSDDHLAFTGHEAELTPYVFGLADPDAWYVNVGAHVGTWSLRMAYRAKRVFALEANRLTYNVLYQNIALNALQKRVVPLLEAAWDEDGWPLNLTDAQGKSSGGSTRVVDAGWLRVHEILSKKLDTIFPPVVNSTERVGFIQMDVEGAEARVLRGAEAILTHDRPNLLIELHEGHPGTDSDLRQQVNKILDRQGYEYHSVRVAGTEEHIVAVPSERPEGR
jgi:FkbM family methyltransferase